MLLGYKLRDLGRTSISEYDTNAGFVGIRGPCKLYELPVARRIGPCSQSFALPIPDLLDPLNMACSIAERILRKNPEIDWSVYRAFIKNAKQYVRNNFSPYIVEENEVLTFEMWLAESTYTEDYKQQLRYERFKWSNVPLHMIKKIETLVFFIKLEEYYKLNVPRGIFASPDLLKARIGPLVASVEKKMYKNKQCVKMFNPTERVQYLLQVFGGEKYFVTVDFKKMESIYTRELIKLVDGFVMKYCLPAVYHSDIEEFVQFETKPMKVRDSSGIIKAKVNCKRCSGAMTTSSGHWLTNIFITDFISVQTQVGYKMVAEGDDNLVKWDGPVSFEYWYNKLGAEIKIEPYYSIGMASFVHLEFNEDTATRFRDAREILMKLTWTLSDYRNTRDKRVLKALLKAKCMSCLYEFPNCPIISPVAYHFYKQVIQYRAIFVYDSYQKMKYKNIEQYECLEPHINDEDRLIYEEYYDITVETQLLLEKAILAVSVEDLYYPKIFDDVLFSTHKYSSDWHWYFHHHVRDFVSTTKLNETVMSRRGMALLI